MVISRLPSRARPFLAGAVPVEFDALAVGIAQGEGLAYPVVGGALQRQLVGEQPAHACS